MSLNQNAGLFEKHSNTQASQDKSIKAMGKSNFLNTNLVYHPPKNELFINMIVHTVILIFTYSSTQLIFKYWINVPLLRMIFLLLDVANFYLIWYLLVSLLAFILSKAPAWSIENIIFKLNIKHIALSLVLSLCFYNMMRVGGSLNSLTFFIYGLEETETPFYKGLYTLLKNGCFVLLPIVLLTTIRKVILEYLNYRIHYKFLKKRILENDRLTESMHQLNLYTRQDSPTDISSWARHVFDCITMGQKETISAEEFTVLFGEENGNSLFILFDINQNGEIDQEEFVEVYENIFEERAALKKSLEETSIGLDELGSLITITGLLVFLAIFILYTVSPYEHLFKLCYLLMLGFIYISSPLIIETINSIIYIFIVHPYDINDEIEINNDGYTVKDIGLLYTDVERDGMVLTLPNDSLRRRGVKNLRSVEYKIFELQRRISTKSIKNISEYKNKIKAFLIENKAKFKPDFELINLEINEGIATFDVVVKINCALQEQKKVSKRKDEISIFLHKLESALFKVK
ncbi:Mechanosensitive ion channel protein Msy1 [Cucumispora dikerogammari]|nr:Mechanosensitive ion channel protein Msy1 [Cucumispora dikerogammari]